MARRLPRRPAHQWNNKTAQTKGSEEDFPWHDDVRATAAVAGFTASFQRKTTLQLTQSQNGLSGLRTNSWLWLPSNSQAGGLSDGIVREREEEEVEGEEEEEEVGAMITQQGFLCGKCSSKKGNSSNLATQPGNPNMEVSREACIFSLYIRNSNTCSPWHNAASHRVWLHLLLTHPQTIAINDQRLSGMSHILLN